MHASLSGEDTRPYSLHQGRRETGRAPGLGQSWGPTVEGCKNLFWGYALSNAVRWTVKGMNFEINAPETLEFVF